jgi:hypothetical protein
VPSKSQMIPKVLYVLLSAIALLITIPDVRAQSSPRVVTVELACEHLFMRVADGPRAATWAARVSNFKGSGLDSKQIQLVIQAANGYETGLGRLSRQAAQIHRDLKSNLITKSAAVGQFTSLDQQRERLLASAFDQLRIELDQDGYSKLEAFLNNVVKPTITFAQ